MTVSGEAIKGVAAGLFSAGSATEQTRAEHVFVRRYVEVDVTDGGTAGTAATERTIHQPRTSGKVLSCYVSTPVTAAANGSNYGTFTLSKRDGAGGGATAIAAADSSATAFTAHTPRALTITAGNESYSSGNVLTIALTKTGTGVAIAAATSAARVSCLLEEGT